MMGLDSYSMYGKFISKSPVCWWHKRQNFKWAPKSREHATCNYVDGCLILFGGLNSKMLNEVCIFNLQEQKWYKVKFEINQQQPEPRYGHSGVIYKSNLYIYGGYRRYNNSFKVRDTYGDMFVFSTKTLKWDKLNWNGLMTFRRHHIAEVVGGHMVIHGGIDHKSRILDSLYLFEFSNQTWSEYFFMHNPNILSGNETKTKG